MGTNNINDLNKLSISENLSSCPVDNSLASKQSAEENIESKTRSEPSSNVPNLRALVDTVVVAEIAKLDNKIPSGKSLTSDISEIAQDRIPELDQSASSDCTAVLASGSGLDY